MMNSNNNNIKEQTTFPQLKLHNNRSGGSLARKKGGFIFSIKKPQKLLQVQFKYLTKIRNFIQAYYYYLSLRVSGDILEMSIVLVFSQYSRIRRVPPSLCLLRYNTKGSCRRVERIVVCVQYRENAGSLPGTSTKTPVSLLT